MEDVKLIVGACYNVKCYCSIGIECDEIGY